MQAGNRLAKLPLAPWLDRVAPRWAMAGGCAVAGLGVLGLALLAHPVALAAVLLICALGTSTNALAVKQMAAGLADAGEHRLLLFGRIASAGNLAAAVSAPCAAWLLIRAGPIYWAALIGCACASAAGLTAWRGPVLAARAESSSAASTTLREIARRPGMRAFLAINACCWFLYYQLFSVVPLALSLHPGAGVLMGPLLTVNTVIVALLQLRVTRGAARLGDEFKQIAAACLLFGLGFLPLACWSGLAALLVFVGLVSAAEMLLVPAIDSAFVGLLGTAPRAGGFALLSVSTAVGESVGAFVGMHLYETLESLVAGTYWVVLASTAIGFAAAASRATNTSTGAGRAMK
ncbi:MAG: MFS transporter [Pelomonas sp.]|nr:MFS transporter [Roseateles sp.]